MICCVGLLVGLFIGQAIGGIWVFVAPAIGFVAGLALDMKYMHHRHGPGSASAAEGQEHEHRH